MTIELFEVGGAVRDEFLGLPTKDVDYTATGESFEHVIECLEETGFRIWNTKPEFFTIRAHFPKGLNVFGGRDVRNLDADIVWARREGPYSDGRRPDWVESGTLLDDLARRDFTVNAIAKDIDGNIIDPFNGRKDIGSYTLRAVGDASARLREDPLRALRAIRFNVTKGFTWDAELIDAMYSTWLPPLVEAVVVDRKRDELTKMFKHDTIAAMRVLCNLTTGMRKAIFTDGLWLMPSNKEK